MDSRLRGNDTRFFFRHCKERNDEAIHFLFLFLDEISVSTEMMKKEKVILCALFLRHSRTSEEFLKETIFARNAGIYLFCGSDVKDEESGYISLQAACGVIIHFPYFSLFVVPVDSRLRGNDVLVGVGVTKKNDMRLLHKLVVWLRV
ncbi:MAG: hypothetical protein LBG21_02460 [Campylobacteraceae bacterium]|jgi:hypothetical protein|nr:hypothetical protein [Campylobacteraceae bacterium]